LTGLFRGDDLENGSLYSIKTAGSLVTKGVCAFESAEPSQTQYRIQKSTLPVTKESSNRFPTIADRVSHSVYESAHHGHGKVKLMEFRC
jgi:hypothetical protein